MHALIPSGRSQRNGPSPSPTPCEEDPPELQTLPKSSFGNVPVGSEIPGTRLTKLCLTIA